MSLVRDCIIDATPLVKATGKGALLKVHLTVRHEAKVRLSANPE
jgi:hypothetical protein